MPNNFRLTGARYISKDGNDANDGLTPDTPKRTFAGYSTSATPIHIVGSGHYIGTFSFGTGLTFTADGFVKLDYTGNGTAGISGLNLRLNNFWIEGNGFQFATSAVTNRSANGCVLKNINFIGGGGSTLIANNNVFLNCIGVMLGNAASLTNPVQNHSGNAFFNCNMTYEFNETTLTFRYNYVSEDTTFISDQGWLLPAQYSLFTDNNFRGKVNILGILYELKKDKAGVDIPSRVANGINDLASLDPTIYDRRNFAQDPEYVSFGTEDYFSVTPTSPNLIVNGNISGIVNIGNSKLREYLEADSATDFPILYGLTRSAGDLSLVVGNSYGYAISRPLQVSSTPKELDRNYVSFLKNFDSSATKGPSPIFTGNNYNITTATNELSGTQGANPRRLCSEIRWTESPTMPLVDADWTNQTYLPVGDWLKVEHFQAPRIDINFKGNGEGDFMVAGSAPLRACWVQYRITIIEGYN